jgi:hypothetical protein
MGESTLSRLIKNKYMDTPIGTVKIQDLFSANAKLLLVVIVSGFLTKFNANTMEKILVVIF